MLANQGKPNNYLFISQSVSLRYLCLQFIQIFGLHLYPLDSATQNSNDEMSVGSFSTITDRTLFTKLIDCDVERLAGEIEEQIDRCIVKTKRS